MLQFFLSFLFLHDSVDSRPRWSAREILEQSSWIFESTWHQGNRGRDLWFPSQRKIYTSYVYYLQIFAIDKGFANWRSVIICAIKAKLIAPRYNINGLSIPKKKEWWIVLYSICFIFYDNTESARNGHST